MTIGKSAKSYTRSEAESRLPDFGYTNLIFSHVSSGEAVIDFTSLTPSPEFNVTGRSNPSPAEIIGASLSTYKNNVILYSSSAGVISPSQYVVRDNQIRFVDYTPQPDEEFVVAVTGILKLGQQLVDMRSIRVEGLLADGTTDFPIGDPVEIQNEDVIVFRDGLQVFKDSVNGNGDGNYKYDDPNNTGYSSLIVFNQPAIGNEPILVVSTGGRAETPTNSTYEALNILNGKMDLVIQDLLDVLAESGDGFDASRYGAVATPTDLAQFGNQVVQNKNDIASLQTNKINKYNIQTGVERELDWTFNGLPVYEYWGEVQTDITTDQTIETIQSGLNPIGTINYNLDNWTILEKSFGSNDVRITYVQGTGQIGAAFIGTGNKIGAGTRYMIRYTKL